MNEITVERGAMLDCGTIENGDPGVVVSSTTGRWETYASELAPVGSGEVGSTQDIALADRLSYVSKVSKAVVPLAMWVRAVFDHGEEQERLCLVR